MNIADLHTLAWPWTQLSEALEALALRQDASLPTAEFSLPPLTDEQHLEPWLAHCAARLGFELEAVQAAYAEVETLISKAGPASFVTAQITLSKPRSPPCRVAGPLLMSSWCCVPSSVNLPPAMRLA